MVTVTHHWNSVTLKTGMWVQILIQFQTFLLFIRPHFQTFNALKSTCIFFDISDYFRLFSSQTLSHIRCKGDGRAPWLLRALILQCSKLKRKNPPHNFWIPILYKYTFDTTWRSYGVHPWAPQLQVLYVIYSGKNSLLAFYSGEKHVRTFPQLNLRIWGTIEEGKSACTCAAVYMGKVKGGSLSKRMGTFGAQAPSNPLTEISFISSPEPKAQGELLLFSVVCRP